MNVTAKSRRLLISALAFALALVPFGSAAFIALSYLFTCPADHPGCDLPDMAAFGMAFILSPLLSLWAAVALFRWLGRQ
jgi:hypothetical protein